MADAPEFTEAQYIALKTAYGQGVKRVKYADKEVEYPSLKEMKALLAEMALELGYTTAGRGRTYGEFNKGLC